MTQFRCIAERCAWNCCRTWRIPVDPAHAAVFRAWVEADGTRPMDGFLKTIRTRRGGVIDESAYFDLPSTPNQRCKFLDALGRCTMQLRFGETALCDTCALFPRRLFQIDEMTFMTASLSCPEIIRALILSQRPLALTKQRSPVDTDVEAIDTVLIPDDSLREFLRQRAAFLTDCFAIIYCHSESLPDRLLTLQAHLTGNTPTPESTPIRKADDAAIGRALLTLEKCLLPPLAPFQTSIQSANHDLFGADAAYERALGAAFREIDERFLSPYFRAQPHIFENYLANILLSDALTEFAQYQRPKTTLREVRAFLKARVCCAVNLLMLRLAAAVRRANAMNDEVLLRVLMDVDRNFWMLPPVVETAIDQLRRMITPNEPVFLGNFLNEAA